MHVVVTPPCSGYPYAVSHCAPAAALLVRDVAEILSAALPTNGLLSCEPRTCGKLGPRQQSKQCHLRVTVAIAIVKTSAHSLQV